VTHWVLPLAIGLAASVATYLGGLLALRFAHRIGLILGLTAGIVLGVALFDLVPEALHATQGEYGGRSVLAGVAIGFGAYMTFDRLLSRPIDGRTNWRAHLGPASLTLHSLFDGIGVGLAFQVSPEIGWAVAIAVLTHDVADGVNTVGLSLASSREVFARRWLIVNALSPPIGILVGLLIGVPTTMLAPLLAVFAGIFLYIGACELIPRSYLLNPRPLTTFATLSGVALMYLVTEWAK